MIVDQPQEGLYRMRAARKGPWLPVHIWQEGEQWRAKMADVEVDPYWVWTSCCNHPITRFYYDYLMRLLAWAEDNEQNRYAPLNLNTLPPLY